MVAPGLRIRPGEDSWRPARRRDLRSNLVAAKWERLVSECCAAIDEVAIVGGRRQKRVICARLFALLHALFSAIDVAVSLHKQGSGMTNDRLDKTLTYVQKNIEGTSRSIRDLALQTDRRVAQQQYLIGMLPGLIIVAAMIFATGSLPLKVNISCLQIVLGAGALGALLSVLVRTTSAQLSKSLRVEYSSWHVTSSVCWSFQANCRRIARSSSLRAN